jgi:hypothetical protein
VSVKTGSPMIQLLVYRDGDWMEYFRELTFPQLENEQTFIELTASRLVQLHFYGVL